MTRVKHHGSIRKRGPDTYQIRLCVGGKYHPYTVKGTFNEAASFANAQYLKLSKRERRRRAGLPGQKPISELIAEFKDEIKDRAAGTQRSYNDSLKPIVRYFVDKIEDPDVADISRVHIRQFLSWRRKNRLGGGTVSNRTRQKDRTVLHTLFEYAIELELRDDNPVRHVKKPEAVERTPELATPELYEKHLEACRGSRQRMLYLFALTLGESAVRSESEALWLRWPDVDLEGGYLWIDSDPAGHETKGRKGRWVPMSPRLVEAMREHFALYRFARYDGRRPEFVFHHTQTRAQHRAGERIHSMRESFKSAAARAGLPKRFGQHDYRHTRITRWLAEGKPLALVQEAAGHSDARTTKRYTHLSREHLRVLVGPETSTTEVAAAAEA